MGFSNDCWRPGLGGGVIGDQGGVRMRFEGDGWSEGSSLEYLSSEGDLRLRPVVEIGCIDFFFGAFFLTFLARSDLLLLLGTLALAAEFACSL